MGYYHVRPLTSPGYLILTVASRSVSAGKQDGISKFMDDVFDAAFNETVLAGDLPNVRWGRIDYFNVTAVTTKWAVWQCVLPVRMD